ncbi:SEC59/DGK1/VTE5 family protein [soil metagenome]
MLRAMDAPANITYRAELARKGIHLCSLAIPVCAWFVPKWFAVAILVAMALGSFAVDYFRGRDGAFANFLNAHFSFMLRPHEREVAGGRIVMTGSTWMLLSAVITFAIFAKPVAVAAFAMLIVCDTAAALVGRRWGRIRFGRKRKSLEGSAAFFIAGVLVAAVTPEVPLWIGAVASLVAAVVEAVFWRVDDNFSIPLSAGAVMTALLALT